MRTKLPLTRVAIAMTAIYNAGFEIIKHPLYYPNLALNDIFLFPKLKAQLYASRFSNDEKVIEVS